MISAILYRENGRYSGFRAIRLRHILPHGYLSAKRLLPLAENYLTSARQRLFWMRISAPITGVRNMFPYSFMKKKEY